jgi:hypothetical protein
MYILDVYLGYAFVLIWHCIIKVATLKAHELLQACAGGEVVACEAPMDEDGELWRLLFYNKALASCSYMLDLGALCFLLVVVMIDERKRWYLGFLRPEHGRVVGCKIQRAL